MFVASRDGSLPLAVASDGSTLSLPVKGEQILAPSLLGLDLANPRPLGTPEVVGVKRATIRRMAVGGGLQPFSSQRDRPLSCTPLPEGSR